MSQSIPGGPELAEQRRGDVQTDQGQACISTSDLGGTLNSTSDPGNTLTSSTSSAGPCPGGYTGIVELPAYFGDVPAAVDLPMFFAVDRYLGPQAGYYFGTDAQGLGYHFDYWQFRFGNASDKPVYLDNSVTPTVRGTHTCWPLGIPDIPDPMHPGFPEFPETVELPAFIKAEAYAGSRPGFYFGTGDRGARLLLRLLAVQVRRHKRDAHLPQHRQGGHRGTVNSETGRDALRAHQYRPT